MDNNANANANANATPNVGTNANAKKEAIIKKAMECNGLSQENADKIREEIQRESLSISKVRQRVGEFQRIKSSKTAASTPLSNSTPS